MSLNAVEGCQQPSFAVDLTRRNGWGPDSSLVGLLYSTRTICNSNKGLWTVTQSPTTCSTRPSARSQMKLRRHLPFEGVGRDGKSTVHDPSEKQENPCSLTRILKSCVLRPGPPKGAMW